MKTIKVIVVATMLFFVSNSMSAQVSVNVNIGTPPVWAPVASSSVNYYYIPDVQTYYDVRATQFIYLNNGVWVRSSHLPSHHRHYDLKKGYKVVLNDYHGSRPYSNYKYHKVKYYKGYKGAPQKAVAHKNHDSSNNHGKSKGNGGKGNNGNGKNGKGH